MTASSGAQSSELTASGAMQLAAPSAATSALPQVLSSATEIGQPENQLGAQPVPAPPAFVAQAQPPAGSGSSSQDRSTPPQAIDPSASSLGFVQKADGKIQSVVADGDTVRLVPPDSGGYPGPSRTSKRFAGRGVFSPGLTPTVAIVSSISGVEAGSSAHPQSSAAVPTDRVAQASVPGAEPGKFPVSIKSTGFVVKANGELDAILAEDDDVQIVRQGDSFDGRYRAVSVSAKAVEAVEETPWHPVPFPTPRRQNSRICFRLPWSRHRRYYRMGIVPDVMLESRANCL